MTARRSIHIEGFSHQNPIPVASRVGNVLMSSVIPGRDPSTGKLPSSLEEQVTHMFGYVRAIVEAAGGTPANIIKITIWLKDPSQRAVLNDEWVKMFPDPDSRPARHTLPLTAAGDSPAQRRGTATLD